MMEETADEGVAALFAKLDNVAGALSAIVDRVAGALLATFEMVEVVAAACFAMAEAAIADTLTGLVRSIVLRCFQEGCLWRLGGCRFEVLFREEYGRMRVITR